MTELETSHFSKELTKCSLEKDGIAETIKRNDTVVADRTDDFSKYAINGREEAFMQLQTELFDILLEIYYITPIWGSFKENFYFHWKKIIGASNIKELHAYRLIFRCMGCLRPSSTPLFVLKVIIKQLDEFRRISEPEYYSENIDLNTLVQGQTVTGFHSPFTLMQEMKNFNFSNYNLEGKKQFEMEKNLLMNNSSQKQYKHSFSGLNDFDENKFLMEHINVEKANENAFNIAGKHIRVSPNNKLVESVCEDMCSMKREYLNSLYFNLSYLQNTDMLSDKIKDTENVHCRCESQNRDLLVSTDNQSKSKYSDYSESCGENSDSGGTNTEGGKNSTTSAYNPNSNNDCSILGSVIPRFQEFNQLKRMIQSQKDSCCKLVRNNELVTSCPPKKRPRRNSEIQGVYFDKIRKLWRANWKENGRVKTKGFSVFQFGDEGAKQRAIEYRKKMEKEFYVTSHSSKSISKDTTEKEKNSEPESLNGILVDCNDDFTQNDVENSDTFHKTKTIE